MLDLTITAEGVDDVVRMLNVMPARTGEAAFRAFKKVGTYLASEFAKNMKAGQGPDGKALPKPAVWTRIAGKGRGTKPDTTNMAPLINTGGMLRRMGNVSVSQERLEFGWDRSTIEWKKALTQQNGIQSEMELRENRIKGLYSGVQIAQDGHAYIRVWNGGGWITRQVQSVTGSVGKEKKKAVRKRGAGGKFVKSTEFETVQTMVYKGKLLLQPLARSFFFLATKQVKEITDIAEKIADEVTK